MRNESSCLHAGGLELMMASWLAVDGPRTPNGAGPEGGDASRMDRIFGRRAGGRNSADGVLDQARTRVKNCVLLLLLKWHRLVRDQKGVLHVCRVTDGDHGFMVRDSAVTLCQSA